MILLLDITKLKAYQRDYIYYSLKSKDDKGYINQNLKDYLNYIEVDSRVYFKFSLDADKKGNPNIKEREVTRRKYSFTTDELIDRMWTKGAYEFQFEIVNSNRNTNTNNILFKKQG
ncbi:hypothetical protein [Sphingobacterium rhinopitheci]|uniref:hypothetical protein n=1 Tax=Sphingobacterium rhinopitheci TaxID=2781960 RepID=UPI001F52519F|nr:hypothetical protein [Sphingobacterium rhinopitheci]MCI0921673.1 hypothetical protein [Sphingobacterium rhinopitheci]